jgi:hypothetical protein
MNGGGRKTPAVVSRAYQTDSDYCARALQLLLRKSMKKATERTPTSDGPDDAEDLENDRTAKTKYTD